MDNTNGRSAERVGVSREAVWRKFESQLRHEEKAFAAKDLEGVLSVYHPEYVETDEDGYINPLGPVRNRHQRSIRVTTWLRA